MSRSRSPGTRDLSQVTYRDPYAATATATAPSAAPSLLTGLRTGSWLNNQTFSPLRYAVPMIIPEGLTVLAGSPKAGKSWLALHIALGVAAGTELLGCLDSGPARPCLYLALEDGWRRLQARAKSLLGDDTPIPDDLDLMIDVEPLVGVATIAEWMTRAEAERPIVIVDTFARLRPPANGNQSAYSEDYKAVGAFKQLADTIPGSSVILVHHTRKQAADDFIDSVSGTAGVAGAADTTVILSRSRTDEEGVLRVTGRDVWEAEYAVQKSDRGLWHLMGGSLDRAQQAAAARKVKAGVGDRSAEVLDLLAAADEPLRRKEITEKSGLDPKQAGMYIKRLTDTGRIERVGHGLYRARGNNVTGVTHPLWIVPDEDP